MTALAFRSALLASAALSISCSTDSTASPRPTTATLNRRPPVHGKAFSEGDGFESVRAAMDSPDASRETRSGTTVWDYKFSTVTFRNGRVVGWNNASNNLRCSGAGGKDRQRNQGNEPPAPDPEATANSEIAISGALSESIHSRRAAPTGSGGAIAPVQKIESYQKSDGSVIPSHYRSRADGSRANNLTSRGNINPYTGHKGTR